MDQQSFQLLMTTLKDIKDRQDNHQDKLENVKDILIEYTDKTDIITNDLKSTKEELKQLKSSVIYRPSLKQISFVLGLPSIMVGIYHLIKNVVH